MDCSSFSTDVDYSDYRVRLGTFEADISLSQDIYVTLLAMSGLYCEKGKLKCFECKFSTENWKDIATKIIDHPHYMHATRCNQVSNISEYPVEEESSGERMVENRFDWLRQKIQEFVYYSYCFLKHRLDEMSRKFPRLKSFEETTDFNDVTIFKCSLLSAEQNRIKGNGRTSYDHASSSPDDQYRSFTTGWLGFRTRRTRYLQSSEKASVEDPNDYQLQAVLDTTIMRRLIDSKIASRDSIEHAVRSNLSDATLRDLWLQRVVRQAMDYDQEREDFLSALPDIVIDKLPDPVKVKHIRQMIAIRYDLLPDSIKIIRIRNELEHRNLCMITLKERDRIRDKSSPFKSLVRDLNGKQYPGFQYTMPLQVFETDRELLELQTPLVDQPAQEPLRNEQNAHSCSNDELCTTCHKNRRNILFLPCAHTLLCSECNICVKSCEYCGCQVWQTIKAN